MKKKWHVLVGVKVRRAYNLNVSKNGWRKREPLDDQSIPTSPILIKKLILTLLENNILNGSSIQEVLSNEYELTLGEGMLEALTGLEEGTLSKYKKT
ncbi:hypothetical protein NXH58_00005 [Agathobacter ruminis]|uniref:hypothetical protein n=1 Tax=Agathobacter ruminis TaxID=1712665 RepID=UPI00234D83D0|nr:hypothetical protein [Agathobacter ruminis]MDC7300181.1 hypothetical protein [Agathobacter ruminis]